MDTQRLEKTARELVPEGKGLLAADESTGTITKRFDAVNIESTEETRRAYREMLFTTPGIGEYLSGVILFDETIRQKASDGTPLSEVIERQGIIPGIKVDKSTVALPLSPEEKYTQGLDGLRDHLEEYREMGARFTKWRAVITIGEGIPTVNCIESNARALALFAAFSQEAGLVPIVEPEVLIDGDHWQRRPRASQRRRGGQLHDRMHAQERAGRRARYRLPLRRAERRIGHRAPERDERHVRQPPVGDILLLGPRLAGQADGDLGWRPLQRRGGAKSLPSPCQDGQHRPLRKLLRGHGGPGSLKTRQETKEKAAGGRKEKPRRLPASYHKS